MRGDRILTAASAGFSIDTEDQKHFSHLPYPLDSADDCDTCLALFGFIRPQLLILWYFEPVSDNQTIPPLSACGAGAGAACASEFAEEACSDAICDDKASFSVCNVVF